MLAFETGARERLSAKTSSFPGTWDMEKLNPINRDETLGPDGQLVEVLGGQKGGEQGFCGLFRYESVDPRDGLRIAHKLRLLLKLPLHTVALQL